MGDVLDIRCQLLDRATSGHVVRLEHHRWVGFVTDAEVTRRGICRGCGGVFLAEMNTADAGEFLRQGEAVEDGCRWHGSLWRPE